MTPSTKRKVKIALWVFVGALALWGFFFSIVMLFMVWAGFN